MASSLMAAPPVSPDPAGQASYENAWNDGRDVAPLRLCFDCGHNCPIDERPDDHADDSRARTPLRKRPEQAKDRASNQSREKYPRITARVETWYLGFQSVPRRSASTPTRSENTRRPSRG